MPLLEVSDLTVSYGRIEALHGISLSVNDGELVTLIGANGAGKTTTMRALSGVRPLTRGRIVFDGAGHHLDEGPPAGRRRDRAGARGPRRVPGDDRPGEPGHGLLFARKFASKAEYRQTLDRVFELFPRLAERRTQIGGTMSGGEQQMLAIGRALMARPRVLLLDEPSMGLAPMIIQQIFRIITEINSQGTTILLVEQNAQQALSRSDRAYVLETGSVIKSGAGPRAARRPRDQGRLPRRRLTACRVPGSVDHFPGCVDHEK